MVSASSPVFAAICRDLQSKCGESEETQRETSWRDRRRSCCGIKNLQLAQENIPEKIRTSNLGSVGHRSMGMCQNLPSS